MSEREGVLARAPLIYALSVIRFAPILKLPKLIPDIQHTIRQSLPGFFQMVKGVPPGVMHSGEPNSWAFLNRDADYACVLAMDHMILQSTNYLHFDNHLALFRECIEALVGQAGALDITAIGMRYGDKIEPAEGETLADYLPEAMLPLKCDELAAHGKVPKEQLGISTTTYHLDPEYLHIRCWRQTGMWIPEDLVEPAMVFEIAKQSRNSSKHGAPLQGAFVPVSENGALLDTDAHWPLQLAERLGTEEICTRLDGLHKTANFAFRTVAKDHAFEVWGKAK